MVKVNDEREQVISVIAEHVNNEKLTKRELAEIVLDLAIIHSTNAEEFLNSVKEMCEENEGTLRVWHAIAKNFLEAQDENKDNE